MENIHDIHDVQKAIDQAYPIMLKRIEYEIAKITTIRPQIPLQYNNKGLDYGNIQTPLLLLINAKLDKVMEALHLTL